jgi:hypothetical protein
MRGPETGRTPAEGMAAIPGGPTATVRLRAIPSCAFAQDEIVW